MRLRACYRLGPDLRFLSNLDTMHLLERALRRAELPCALSQGFNPHIRLSMGTVLPVGLWSEAEYFDLELAESLPIQDFIMRLNAALPPDIYVKQAVEIGPNTPALMHSVNAAAYTLVLDEMDFPAAEFFAGLLVEQHLVVKSRGKKKDLDKDLRSGIYRIDVEEQRPGWTVTLWVAAGEPLNVRYDELLELLNARGLARNLIKNVYRQGNYIYQAPVFASPIEKVK